MNNIKVNVKLSSESNVLKILQDAPGFVKYVDRISPEFMCKYLEYNYDVEKFNDKLSETKAKYTINKANKEQTKEILKKLPRLIKFFDKKSPHYDEAIVVFIRNAHMLTDRDKRFYGRFVTDYVCESEIPPHIITLICRSEPGMLGKDLFKKTSVKDIALLISEGWLKINSKREFHLVSEGDSGNTFRVPKRSLSVRGESLINTSYWQPNNTLSFYLKKLFKDPEYSSFGFESLVAFKNIPKDDQMTLAKNYYEYIDNPKGIITDPECISEYEAHKYVKDIIC